MVKCEVVVTLSESYDDIEADSEEETFQIANKCAMEGGSWQYCARKVNDE